MRVFEAVERTAPRTRVPLGGINVDVDEVLASDYGQWDLDP